MNQQATPQKVKLSAVTASMIPTGPKALAVEHDGMIFNVMRVDPKQLNSWRGTYVVMEADMTDYYTDSVAGIREWVRLCCEVSREVSQKLSA